MTLGDIEEEELWEEHTRERIAQMEAERRSWWHVGEQAVWATEDEAREQWRKTVA